MKMNDSILLFIDQKRRDSLPVVLIYKYLTELGIKTIIATSSDFFLKYLYHKPKVVLQAHPDSYHGEWTRFMSQYSVVCSLPTEQQMSDPEQLKKRIIGGHNPGNDNYNIPYIEGISTFYIWSETILNVLSEDNEFSGKLTVTGNPRIVDISEFSKKTSSINRKHRKKISIGIALEDELNQRNIAEFISLMSGYHFNEFGPVENFSAVNIHITKTLLEVIRELNVSRNDINIIIRPRLSDNPNNYAFLTNKYSNLHIDNAESPFQFFNDIDCLILAQSSIGTEAQMAGIPTVSVYALMKEVLDFYNIERNAHRLNHYWMPESMTELDGLLNKIKDSVLPVSRNMSDFKAYIHKYYIQEKQFSHPSYLIAQDLSLKLSSYEQDNDNINRDYLVKEYFIKLLPMKLRGKVVSDIIFSAFNTKNFMTRAISTIIIRLTLDFYAYSAARGKNENYFFSSNAEFKKYDDVVNFVKTSFDN